MQTLFALLLLVLAWLLPFHKSPWPTFYSEILTFFAACCLLLDYKAKTISIARPQLIALPILTIPLLQWCFGLNLYLSNALACSAYLIMFWLMVVLGQAWGQNEQQREKSFQIFAGVVLAVSVISSLIALCQWLNLSSYFSPWMYAYKGNRPYANLAQPNNLATLLSMGLMACLYFFEKKQIRNVYLIPTSLLLVFSIALTQSRTSWVTCLFILFYLGIKQWGKRPRFNHAWLLAWVAVFMLCVGMLPTLNHWVGLLFSQELTATSSAVERATSGYLRLDMWQQVGVAISQQPWLGYGWNQTGMAQIAAFDAYPSHEWYKSAHNIIFDLLVWNGVLIGGLIVLYLTAWLLWLNRGVKDSLSICASLMVCAVLIHGMLEYPLHYAYFLLPVGFLLGLIQAQYKHLPKIQVNAHLATVLALLCMIGCVVSVRDYVIYKQQSPIASRTTPRTATQQQIMNQDIWLLTQFKQRIEWIELDPKTKMSTQQLQLLGKMVANLASKYDLYKYAQVLAFNGQQKEAEHQLWILSELHGQKTSYTELLESLD